MLAAKLLMGLLACCIPLLAWRATDSIIAAPSLRLAASLACALSAPFIYQATQIYPDLPAGLCFAWFSLSLFQERLSDAKRVDAPGGWLLPLLLAATPWLHMRLAAPLLVCVVARLFLDPAWLRRAGKSGLVWLLLPTASLLGLAYYNFDHFGALGGPYQAGNLVFSPTALMVLIGLHLDQFQGVFLAAPILAAAVAGWAALARRDVRLVLFMLALHAALVLPNALHPNWYGGGSLAGRFVLAAALPLLIPAVYALSLLARRNVLLFWAVILVELALQYHFWRLYSGAGFVLTNQPASTYLLDYSSFWQPWQRYLPAFYQTGIALLHGPNFAALLALLCLALAAGRGTGLLAWLALPILLLGAITSHFEPFLAPLLAEPQLAILSEGAPSQIRLAYGSFDEALAMAKLTHNLRDRGVAACIETPLTQFPPAALCPPLDPADHRVRRLQLVPADYCGDACLVRRKQWGLLNRPPQENNGPVAEIFFGAAESRRYLGPGWSGTEIWGVWSDSHHAELHFNIADWPRGNLRLSFDMLGFVMPFNPRMDVPISVNGQPLGHWVFDGTFNDGISSLWIPADRLKDRDELTIGFDALGEWSAASAGLSADSRLLGIGIRRIRIFPAL